MVGLHLAFIRSFRSHKYDLVISETSFYRATKHSKPPTRPPEKRLERKSKKRENPSILEGWSQQKAVKPL
jgi:hypothetical protein